MRILAVRGRNLASLSGDFEIRFDAEPLAGSGIFAITGPTGAGKSTLLDAMCLALFDRIPRLRLASNRSKVVGGPEEEMSATDTRGVLRRGVGEGYAEVEFADNHRRRYRSRWTARRARGRADGRLQVAEMALWGPDGAALAGGRKADVLAEIEARLGLGFEQFRRSALLAQGEFAAFLHADPTERANVLERVTGTEIYARLSMAAHAREVAAAAELAKVKARLDLTGALAQDVREAREIELQDLLHRRGDVQAARDQAQAALDWHLRDADLERAWRDAQAAWERLEAEQAGQADAYARDLAQEALEAARPAMVAADAARRGAEQARVFEQARAAEADVARAAAAAAAAVAAAAAEEHEVASRRFTAQDQEIAQAAGLDAAWEAANAAARARASERDEAAERARVAAEAASAADRALADARQARAAAAAALQAVAGDARWVQSFEAVDRALFRLASAVATAREQRARAERADDEASAAASAAAEADQQVARLEQAARDAAAVLDQRAAEQASIPDPGPRAAAWERRRARVDLARDLARRVTEDRRTAQEAEGQSATDEGLAKAAAERATATAAELPALQAREEEARAAALALRDALSLEDRRARLVDGEPCPLCGAEHHPWAGGAGPAQAALAAQEGRARDLRQQIERTTRERGEAEQQAALARQRAQAARRRAGDAWARVEEAEGRWATLWAEEPALGPEPADPAALIQALRDEGDEIAAAQARSRAADDAVRAAREADLASRAACQAAEKRAKATSDALGIAKAAQAGRRAEAEAAAEAAAQCRTEAAELVPTGIALDDPASVRTSLARRAEEYRLRVRGDEDAVRRQSEREAAWRERVASSDAARGAAAQAAERAAEAENAAALARDRRAGALGGLPTGEARARLDAERTRAEQDLRGAAGRAARAAAAAEAAEIARDRAAQESARAAAEAASAYDRWQRALALRGVDEASARAALARPEDELRASLSAHRERADRARDARTLRAERERNLRAHRGDDAPPEREVVEQAMDGIRRELHEISVQAAALEASLRADDEARASAAELRAEVASLASTHALWAQLDVLIGSQDGRKFKRYAQGLTLDALLLNANRHLKTLAPRYTLLRVPGSELDLQVLDGDLGDEVRAVYSLSGGETFLVSLALALGLAALSAADTPVETLFIDEGFGTLDPETLESALAVLDALQAGGRQVGIISHVPGLADRVGAQIRVIPTGAGRSRVEVR